MNNFDNDFYNDFNEIDNDENVDVDEPSTIFSKFKSRFNKTTNNIKSKFNKNESDVNDSSSYEDDDNLENVDNVAFYRKKPFIFGSIGLVSIALLATAIAIPLSLQTTFLSTSVLKPISPTDFDTKLQIVNNLSNNEKINIWNSYVNVGAKDKLNWENPTSQPKILNFLKTNFDAFNTTTTIGFTPQGGTKVQKSISEVFKEMMDILIAKNTYYYSAGTNDFYYKAVFARTPANESFFSLTSKGSGALAINHTDPLVSIASFIEGIPDVLDPRVGVSKNNVKFTFSLDEMTIEFPYNGSYFSTNVWDIGNITNQPFVFFLEDKFSPFTGYYLKPINNKLTISKNNPIFSDFNTWIEDYLTKNYN